MGNRLTSVGPADSIVHNILQWVGDAMVPLEVRRWSSAIAIGVSPFLVENSTNYLDSNEGHLKVDQLLMTPINARIAK